MFRRNKQNRHVDGRYAPDSSGRDGVAAPGAAPVGAWERLQRATRGWCDTHQAYRSSSGVVGCLDCMLEQAEKVAEQEARAARVREGRAVKAAVADALPDVLAELGARQNPDGSWHIPAPAVRSVRADAETLGDAHETAPGLDQLRDTPSDTR
jgi:hypothetical protein